MTARPFPSDDAARFAFDAARNVCRRHGGSFYFASFFLSSPRRQAAYAVVAFFSLIRLALREPDPCLVEMVGNRIAELYGVELELPQPQFRDESQHVLASAAETVRRFEIPSQCFTDFAGGCAADATVSRYATWNALQRHCEQMAGGPARAIACVLGLTHSDANRYMIEIGRAIYLTDSLTTLKQDAARQKIYLPLQDLARFRYSERELFGGVVNERFRELMRFEIERIRRLFHDGASGLCWLAGDGSRMAAATLLAAHRRKLDQIERSAYDVFRRPPRENPFERLVILPAAWRLARRRPDEPLPDFC